MITEHTTAPRALIKHIEPDPNQPRKTFDEDKLDELAESVRVHGVVVPLVLRPHPTKNSGHLMIVDGERRWRAADMAGLTDVPYVLRELDDRQALELQLVTYAQREDLPPLEEAEAFERLLEEHDYTMDALVAKTGKSKSHLYSRLRLLKLSPYARKMLTAGKLSPMIAGLAATISTPALQDQYVEDVLAVWKGDGAFERADAIENIGIAHEDLNPEAKNAYGKNDPQPLSFRAAQALLHRKYATRLSVAKFPTADAMLVPEAGACTTCPHRSGNQPDLFPDLSKPEDVCTHPPCFEKKTAAVWFTAKAEASARGLEIVEGKEAEGVFAFDGTTTRKSAYVDPDAELPWDLHTSPGKGGKWSKLLGKKLDSVPRVLVQDQGGAPRELIDKRKALELLREMGKIDKAPTKSSSSSGGSNTGDWEERQKKEQAKRELKEAACKRSFEQIAAAAAEDPGKKELALWRWIATAAIADIDEVEWVAERHGLTNKQPISSLVEKAKSVDEIRRVLVECFASQVGNRIARWPNKDDRELWDDICKLLGVDHDKSLAAAKDAAKAEAKADAAKADKKKAAKKGKAKS